MGDMLYLWHMMMGGKAMRIKEAACETGLTERAIRLYEEHGLITPSVTNKNGRDFRDYTDADVAKLKTIASLRRALFTIDEIKTMESSPESIPEIVSSHRKRMHVDFENLSYLVDHIDRVDELSVTSTEELADAIFAPTALPSRNSTDPTEEEKILFSEQYERIYEKYFSENTGWERKYSLSLALGSFFEHLHVGKLLKLVGIALAAVAVFFFVCYGIADVTKVSYTLTGYSYYVGDEDAKEPAEIRIEGKYKNYIFRSDSFEGLVYVAGYEDILEKTEYRQSFYVSEDSGIITSYAAAKDELIVRNDATLVHYEHAYTADGEPCLIRVIGSFDEDFKLTYAAVLVYPQYPNRPGTYTWNDDARVICVALDPHSASDAYELFIRYTSRY